MTASETNPGDSSRDSPRGRPPSVEERHVVREARVGRLATVDAWNRPAIVPFCFALTCLAGDSDPVIVSVLDEKPKRAADADLARVRNIERNPDVAFIVDHYEEDWSRLTFVQVRGRASLLAPAAEGHTRAIAALREKYPQYREMAIDSRLVIVIADLRASSWRAADADALSR